MLYPLIGARLHGWLDDAVVLTYLAGAYLLKLAGAALAIALSGALVHFVLTRVTDYPQGAVKLVPFRAHAYIELAEGLLVMAGAWSIAAPSADRIFLTLMGASQLVAFSFSDYGR